jgi:hypothetical protein
MIGERPARGQVGRVLELAIGGDIDPAGIDEARVFGIEIWEPDDLIATLGLDPQGGGGAGVLETICS